MKNQRWLWAVTAVFGLFIFLIIVLADLGKVHFLWDLINIIPGGDKTGHFILIGVLACLLNLSFGAPRTRGGKGRLLRVNVILGILITIEEFTQMMVPWRGFSIRDGMANILGIILFGRLAAWVVKRSRTDIASAPVEIVNDN